MGINRFDVLLVNLDPTIGSEIKKTRPCVVISPDELNNNLRTSIIAPMTTKIRLHYPSRILCKFQGKQGHIVLDQIRTIDNKRIVRKLGKINLQTANKIASTLKQIFS